MLWNACNGTSLATTDYALVFKPTLCNWLTSEAVDTHGMSSWQTEVTETTASISETSKEKDKYMLVDAVTWIQMRTRLRRSLVKKIAGKGKRIWEVDNRQSVVNICSPVLDKDFVFKILSSVNSISFENALDKARRINSKSSTYALRLVLFATRWHQFY